MVNTWDNKAHVFSSDPGEWSMVEFSKKFNIGSPPYKGELFWCGNGGRLLGFDLYNSACSRSFEIEQPIELRPMEFFDCVGLGVCLGCLRICQILVQSHICVWELKDYDSQGAGKWCLEHKASLKEFVSEKSLWPTQYVNQIIPLITVLGFHPIDGNILYLGIELKAVVCNLRKKTLEVFCNLSGDKHWSSMRSFLNYVLPSWPTLIPS